MEHIERTFEYVRPSELVIGKADRGRMAEFSLTEIAEYGVLDILTPYFLMCEQIRIANDRGYPNFYKFMVKQVGPIILAMTTMEQNGIDIDLEYLESIASPVGTLAELIRESATQIAQTDAASKANDLLLQGTSYQSQGLFGQAEKPWLWNIRKSDHLQLLFVDVMGLQPLEMKDNGTASLNAKFQKVYRHTEEVSMYTDYQKLTKLKSAFADAIYKFLTTNPDMKHDKRLRPVFTTLEVLTGRSSTIMPSTQQLPQHGKKAKIIKQQFSVAKATHRIIGKADFSAHEVRVSGNISDDANIIRAVDAVNEAIHRYRVAGEKTLPDAKVYLDENGGLARSKLFCVF